MSAENNKSGDGAVAKRPSRYSNLFSALLWAITFTFISAADLFGLESATRTQSERAIQAVQQLAASVLVHNRKSIADDILVIEYDETDFRRYGWPIRFARLNSLLDSFHDRPPKALFIDIVLATPRVNGEAEFCAFADRLLRLSGNPEDELWKIQEDANQETDKKTAYVLNRPQISSDEAKWLKKTLYRKSDMQGLVVNSNCIERAINALHEFPALEQSREDYAYERVEYIAGEGGIPILLGVDSGYFSEPFGRESLAADAVPGGGHEGVESQDEAAFEAYAMAQLAILDKVATFAPINTGLEGGRKYIQLVNGSYPSPAYLMARSVACNSGVNPDKEDYKCRNIMGISKARDEAKKEQVLSIIANPGEPPGPIKKTKLDRRLFLFWGAIPNDNSAGCIERANIFPKTMSMLLFGQAYGASFSNAINYQPCPYHAVWPFGCSIQHALEKESDGVERSRNDCVQLSPEGKFVFMGVKVQLLRDFVTVPVQGSLPAVHAHSTAFDNYLRRDSLFATPDWGEAALFGLQFFLIFLALLIFGRIRDDDEKRTVSGALTRQRPFLLRPLSTVSAAQIGMLLGLYLLAFGAGSVVYNYFLYIENSQPEIAWSAVMRDAVLFIGCFIFGGSLLAGGVGLLFDYWREAARATISRSAFLKDMMLMIGCFAVIWFFIYPLELGAVTGSDFIDDADGKLAFFVAYYTTLIFFAAFLFSISVSSLLQAFAAVWPRQDRKKPEGPSNIYLSRVRDAVSRFVCSLPGIGVISKSSDAIKGYLSPIKQSLRLAGAHFIALLLIFLSIIAVSFALSATLKIPAANIYSIFFGIIIAYGFVFVKYIKDELPVILKDM